MVTAEITFSVEFYDVDSMHIVWHGNYIKYFEKARCALLDQIGYGYPEMKESGYAFPVVALSVKYLKALTFRDQVRAKAVLIEYENGLRIKYELRNEKTGEIHTKALSDQMAVDLSTGKACFVCPEILIKKIENLKK
ncbi:MAG: acyl-CoA thioesterase [Spirochaetaceae bacterium]|jgi:acyl-CoA thioester hydrolase|nr:acyl-CoA thioesterase [Spirochaetaceae bacterium]